MALSPDGTRVAYSLLEEDPTTKQVRHKVMVADADGENPILALSIPHLPGVYGVGLLSWNDEQFVCLYTDARSFTRETDIFIIDWKTGKVKEYQRGPAHDCFLMNPSRDGKLPFRSCDCKSIILWDLKTGKKWRELKPRDSENVRLAVYHESSKMWAVVSDVGCTFFNRKGKELFRPENVPSTTTWLLPGGRDLWYFADYYSAGTVYSIDYSRLRPQKVTVYTPPAGPKLTNTNLIALVPKINWLAVASRDLPENPDEEPSGRITLVDLKSRQIRAVIENDTITVLDPPRPAVHPGD